MSETTTPLAVGVIGYGLSGKVFHAPFIDTTPGMELAGIVTSSPQRQAEVSAKYPKTKLYSNAEDFFADVSKFDLVIVAVTNDLHYEFGSRLVEAGIPTIIEKPLAVSVADAEKLVERAKELGSYLSVFQNRRWDGDFRSVKAVVESGCLGEIARFVSRFEAPNPEVGNGWRDSGDPAAGGGVLLDLGSHLVDQAVSLFGEVREVYAEALARRAGAQVDDDTFISLGFANGVRAHLTMSKLTAEPQARFHVVGTKGSYTKYGLDPQEPQLLAGMLPTDAGYGLTNPPTSGSVATFDAAEIFVEPVLEGCYQDFWEATRDALRTGAPAPVDPADAVYTMRILAAAQRSAAERKVITLS